MCLSSIFGLQEPSTSKPRPTTGWHVCLRPFHSPHQLIPYPDIADSARQCLRKETLDSKEPAKSKVKFLAGPSHAFWHCCVSGQPHPVEARGHRSSASTLLGSCNVPWVGPLIMWWRDGHRGVIRNHAFPSFAFFDYSTDDSFLWRWSGKTIN